MIYYGITIGPIIDTLSQASTPASLWYASYMFSELTRSICDKLVELAELHKDLDIQIIAPYYPLENSNQHTCIGYGKFHDRVLFTLKDDSLQEEIEGIGFLNYKHGDDKNPIVKIIDKISDKENERKYLLQYIQVRYICMQEKDPLIKMKDGVVNALNYYLDCLELEQSIFTRNKDKVEVENPFQRLFYGTSESQNKYIKESKFYKEIEQGKRLNDVFTLTEKGAIRKLEDIATVPESDKTQPDLRRYKYYAIVQADGDNMGKYITYMQKEYSKNIVEKFREFSKRCLEYTEESAEKIKNYGGTVIFAGGDDLLFLAPIMENKENNISTKNEENNIFTLIREISDTFDYIFREEIKEQKAKGMEKEKLALSFGVAIAYYKFPLYENFNQARKLLFENAKGGKTKNNVAISLRKGNSVIFGFTTRINGQIFEKFIENIKMYYGNCKDDVAEQQKRINSVIYLLKNWSNMFSDAFSNGQLAVKNVFNNLFDHEFQKKYSQEFIDDVRQFASCVYCSYLDETTTLISDEKEYETPEVATILSFLQLAKFLTEKNNSDEE